MKSPGKAPSPLSRRLLALFFILSIIYPTLGRAQIWKVAIVLPLTGPLSPIGQRLKSGYQLAMKEARQRGENLQILWIDEKAMKKPGALSHLTQTLQDPHLLAILGAYSSHETFTLAGLAERTHTPLIIPSSMADRLTRQGYRWVFRICPSNLQYLKDFLSYMVSLFPSPPSTVLVYEDTQWGRKLRAKLGKLLKKRIKRPPLSISYIPGGNHYPQLMEALERAKPSLVLLVSSLEDTKTLYKTIRERGIPCTVACTGMGLSSPEVLEKGVPSLNGLYFPSLWIPQAPWPEARIFVREYRKAYKELPDYHTAEAYTALTLLLDVLKGKTYTSPWKKAREKVRNILEKRVFSTPLGPVSFPSKEGYTHQNWLPPLIVQIQRGRPVILYPPRATMGSTQPPNPFQWPHRPGPS